MAKMKLNAIERIIDLWIEQFNELENRYDWIQACMLLFFREFLLSALTIIVFQQMQTLLGVNLSL